MKSKHPGFKAVAKKIEGEGYSKRAAGAILANATRNASGAAKKENPKRLYRVFYTFYFPSGLTMKRVKAGELCP